MLQIIIPTIILINLNMILQCNNADEGCGLPGDEGTVGEKCGNVAETIAGNSSLSEGAIYGKGKWVIFTVPR
jgi:hypothetical protein